MKTALTQFFEFMSANNYFIGNDLVEKYHELKEEERKQITGAYYACYQDEITEGEDAMFYGRQHYRTRYENNDSTTKS
jgi:hypothetical protein